MLFRCSVRGWLHSAFSKCVSMSDKPFDAEVCDIGKGSLCDKRFVGPENAIQNAPCNRPLSHFGRGDQIPNVWNGNQIRQTRFFDMQLLIINNLNIDMRLHAALLLYTSQEPQELRTYHGKIRIYKYGWVLPRFLQWLYFPLGEHNFWHSQSIFINNCYHWCWETWKTTKNCHGRNLVSLLP
jgi:hypothetical protein